MITPRPAPSIPISLSQQIQNYPVGSYDSYPTASLDNRTAFADGFLPSLTVRAREQDPRIAIPNSEWSFGVCESGKPATPDEKHVCYPAGFEPGRLYELIYRAKDPTVGGLGFAALRDLGAFLRNSPRTTPARGTRYRPEGGDRGRDVAERPHGPEFPGARLQCRRERRTGVRRAYPHIGGGGDAAQCPLRAAGARMGRADRPSLSGL